MSYRYNDFRSGCQKVISLPSVISLLRKSINTSIGQVFILQYSEFIKLMLDRQVLSINSIYLYTVFQNGVFVFNYFEILLSVQEETRRNERKKKNKQKTGVGLNSLSLKT